ncbi:MAG TPA: EAL domain-containing protein [Polyangia bacterium]|jgi:EAL domain-containing protein (putative c-di-GMP-specific phosphodiesterase class I)
MAGHGEDATAAPAAPSTAAPSRGQVLVVDDDLPTARGFGRVLSSAGFTVTLAHDGAEAAVVARQGSFDVILSDIGMPGMSGIALLRAVREHDVDVPVILITGGPAIESAVEAMEYGALLYLIKPIEAQDLEDAITRGVRLHQMALIKREALALFHIDNKVLGDRAGLEARFENALATLWVAYQPIVSWSAQHVFAYEALVRNKEPTLRSPPDLFEAAERLGRLQELGRVIRNRVAKTADELPSGGLLFVNVHAMELDDDSLFSASAPLSRHAKQVVLEITERAPIEKIRDVGNRVAQLRALGYRIAVDDLGAGYAGLASFAHLEPEVVKVDMSLIRGLDRSPMKQKLLSSIVTLCQELGIQMIAEGIETEAERDMLVNLGGDLCQGYLFARPQLPWANTDFGGAGRDPDSNQGS